METPLRDLQHPRSWAGGGSSSKVYSATARSSSGQGRPSPLPQLEGDPGPPLKKYPSQGRRKHK
ncbi:UNVERIFIED_CONTAM: hypothetical protein Slati_1354200 [Sesamum latifolium]|uniref:Uncharacterized protein n=1 Tax=Sesamum latifolium TaxID=2727402 RepID=A0AAW2XNH4_9LAMI